jgi:hypothetical protein
METVYITEEELNDLTNPDPDTLNEMNGRDPSILTDEEYARDIQNCVSLEEFRRLWGESIKRIIPNP